jgi:hypothetical protein
VDHGPIAALAKMLFGFVASVARYPVPTLATIVVAAPVLNFGRALGLPLLFWHEDPHARARAGAAVTGVFATLALVVHLLEAGRMGEAPPLARTFASAAVLWAALVGGGSLYRWWRARTAATTDGAPGLTPAIGTVSNVAAPGWTPRSTHVDVGPFVRGAVVTALGVALAVLIVDRVAADGVPPHWLLRALFLDARDPYPWLHVLALVLVVGLGIAFGWVRRSATPAVAICMLLAGLVAIDGFCTFRTGHPAPTLAGGLALLLWGGRDPYKMRIRALRDRYAEPSPYPPAPRDRPQAFVDLQRAIEQRGEARPLVVVCASGGGIRAAVWTARILERLDGCAGFRPAARLATGASGGMVGAAFWVASLRSSPQGAAPNGVDGDGLTAVARRLAFGDVPLAFLPFANEGNRGQALEDAWRAHGGAPLDATFAQLRAGEQEGRWPSLVFSPMLVEDGRRLLISNVDLTAAARNLVRWIDRPAPDIASTSAYHLADVVPGALDEFPVRTAARLSASFPYVSPAAVLPTRPRRRVVDAGYYDNYGLSLACGWIRQSLREPWFARHVSRVLVVQIRDNVSPLSVNPDREPADQQRIAATDERALGIARGLEGITTPPEGLLAARDSVMLFRNDADLEALTKLADERLHPGFLTTTVFELKGDVSLSWYLTREEIGTIGTQVASPGITGKVRHVCDWL